MTEIYRAGSQLIKVRVIMLVSLIAAGASSWYGWDLFQTYGLRAADGGVLAPLSTRLALGLFVASLGILFAYGMWFYGRLYASAIRYDEAADALHFRTVGFVGGGEAVHPAATVLGADYHEGRFDNRNGLLYESGGGVSVDAPWFSVKLEGRRWPLILDARGYFTNRALAAKLLKLG